MDIFGFSTSALGILALLGLLVWQRNNLSQIYLNVILMTAILVSGFTSVAGMLLGVGAGEIILPLTSIVAVGLIGLASVYAKRAKSFATLLSPLNISALIVFLGGIGTVMIGLGLGLDPFLAAQQAAVEAAAAGLADGARGAAVDTLMVFLAPLFTGAVAVITNFASRDSSSDEEEDAPAPSGA